MSARNQQEVSLPYTRDPEQCHKAICKESEYILAFYWWQDVLNGVYLEHCKTGKVPSIRSPLGDFLDVKNIYIFI